LTGLQLNPQKKKKTKTRWALHDECFSMIFFRQPEQFKKTQSKLIKHNWSQVNNLMAAPKGQQKAFTKWVNLKLTQAGKDPITDIASDFRSGAVLVRNLSLVLFGSMFRPIYWKF